MVNFNPFGKPGCSEDGQGFYTLTQTQNSVCYVFSPPFPTIVQSAFITDIISGCVGEFPTAIDPHFASSLPC